jgi:hypothetical protein
MTETNDRHSPLGIFHLAKDFYRSAHHLEESKQAKNVHLHYSQVVYHLYNHSIELSLKAFLRASGVPNDDLKKKHRHNTQKMFERAIAERLCIGSPDETDHAREVVKWLNHLELTRPLRYFQSGAVELPLLPDVRLANERLLKAVAPACKREASAK